MRRSRTGWRSASVSSSIVRIGPSTISVAATIAAESTAPAITSRPCAAPQASSIGGRASAAANPPIGTAVCRTPSAKPRSLRANQLVTARPVAVLALAPNAAIRKRSATRGTNAVAWAAAASAADSPEHPDRRGRALPDPVGREPPGEEREQCADARDPEQHADLGQAQVVVVAELGREHGESRDRPGLRGQHESARQQDRPAPQLRRGAAGTRACSSCPRSGSWWRRTAGRPPSAAGSTSPCPRA